MYNDSVIYVLSEYELGLWINPVCLKELNISLKELNIARYRILIKQYFARKINLETFFFVVSGLCRYIAAASPKWSMGFEYKILGQKF